jgi:hypothetical protein
MKQLAAFGLLLVMLGGCIPEPRTPEEIRAATAKADSSAAGYEVGIPRPTIASAPKPVRSGVQAADPVAQLPLQPAPSGISKAPLPKQRTVVGHDTAPAVARPSARVAAFPPLDPQREKDYLVSDAERKTAVFQLTAGIELGNRVSFNAVNRGARVLSIPVGWKLTVNFVNQDPELPHSAVVVASTDVVPEELSVPAFAGARTVKLEEGLLEGDSDEMTFIADRVGRYLLACGVLGHAQRGQWLTLTVSDSISSPTYR